MAFKDQIALLLPHDQERTILKVFTTKGFLQNSDCQTSEVLDIRFEGMAVCQF